MKGIVLNYDEKSKRIYGPHDDLNKQYGWDNTDGFEQIAQEEIPFEVDGL